MSSAITANPYQYLPQQHCIPGGVAIVELPIVSKQAPKVYFLGNRVTVAKLANAARVNNNQANLANATNLKPAPCVAKAASSSKLDLDLRLSKAWYRQTKAQPNWHSIVGLPLSLKPGIHNLTIVTRGRAHSKKEFTVFAHQYPKSHISIPDNKMVQLDEANLRRVQQEKQLINKIYRSWADWSPTNLKLDSPIKTYCISSPFGVQRLLNGKVRSQHSGLDLAAEEDTAILAPMPGKVLATGNYFFGGNMVFVQHGQGLISSYAHLNQIRVTAGQWLEMGDEIGTLGKTGRVTGPHLHWSVSLNGSLVNPELFLSTTTS